MLISAKFRIGIANFNALIKTILCSVSFQYQSDSIMPSTFCVKLNFTEACNTRVGIDDG